MEKPFSPDLSTDNQDLQEILAENNRLLQEVKAGNEKILSYLRWSRIWSLLRLLIIVIPIILGILYLRPYFQNAFSAYHDLLGIPSGSSSNSSNSTLDLLEELKKYQR